MQQCAVMLTRAPIGATCLFYVFAVLRLAACGLLPVACRLHHLQNPLLCVHGNSLDQVVIPVVRCALETTYIRESGNKKPRAVCGIQSKKRSMQKAQQVACSLQHARHMRGAEELV
jgi:hypothetical protein